MGAASCAALVGLALALTGCGGGSPSAPQGTGAQGPGQAAPTREGTGAGTGSAIAGGSCPTELSRFTRSLQRLRRRLVAGLTYAEYLGGVKALGSEYAAIPIATMPSTCLIAAGTPSERAFDIYVEAANRWGGCLSEPGCDAGDVEAPLQAEWHLASRELADLAGSAKERP